MGELYNSVAPKTNKILRPDDSIVDGGDSAGHPYVNPKSLDPINDKVVAFDAPCDSKVGITASTVVMNGPGVLYGFVIVSHTPGASVRPADALAVATAPYVCSAITTVAGHIDGDVILFGKGIKMVTGCAFNITGTIEVIPLVRTDPTA